MSKLLQTSITIVILAVLVILIHLGWNYPDIILAVIGFVAAILVTYVFVYVVWHLAGKILKFLNGK